MHNRSDAKDSKKDSTVRDILYLLYTVIEPKEVVIKVFSFNEVRAVLIINQRSERINSYH